MGGLKFCSILLFVLQQFQLFPFALIINCWERKSFSCVVKTVINPSQLPRFLTNEGCQVLTQSSVLQSEEDLQDIHSL